MNLRRFGLGMFAAVFVLSAAVLSFASDDPPSRVARLKYIDGQVSVQPGGVDDWVAAAINRPLTTADNVWTDRDSRAELHLGTAALRMSSETSVTLTNLTDSTVQVQLHQGTLNLRISSLFRGEIYEIDTPNMAFTVQRTGSYRFDVDANGDSTLVTVWSGKGVATGEGRAVEVKSGKQARFTNGNSLAHEIYKAPAMDGFDDWARVRDSREDHVYAVRYVPRSVIGYEDLDEYGTWRLVPAYGWVWAPRAVVVGWAPYRFGHWIWVSPWGWTWVDDAPWGFAPFHYGRWVYTSGYWGWIPGPIHVRPCYAPALVAWVGGANWGIGISFGGGVGWFPLGYGEPYIPYYRASRNYFRTVNITNTRITNITYVTNNYYNNVHINNIHYVNRGVPGAVTAVPHDVLVNSRPVSRTAIHLGDRDLRDAEWINGPRVPPSHRTVLGLHGDGPGAAPPGPILRRAIVEKLPAPPRPERFEARFPNRGNDDADRGRRDDAGRVGGPNGRNGDRDDVARSRNGRDDDDRGHNGRPDFPRPPRNGDKENDRDAHARDNDDHAGGRNDDAGRGGHDNDASNGRDNRGNDARNGRDEGRGNAGRNSGFGNNGHPDRDANSGNSDENARRGSRNADFPRPGRNADADDRNGHDGQQPNRPANPTLAEDKPDLPRSVPRPPRRNADPDKPVSTGDAGQPREHEPGWKHGNAAEASRGAGASNGGFGNSGADRPASQPGNDQIAREADPPRSSRTDRQVPRPPDAGRSDPAAQPNRSGGSSDNANAGGRVRRVPQVESTPTETHAPVDRGHTTEAWRPPQVDRSPAATQAPVDRGRSTDTWRQPQVDRSVPRPSESVRMPQPGSQPHSMPDRPMPAPADRGMSRGPQMDRGSTPSSTPRMSQPPRSAPSAPQQSTPSRSAPRSAPDNRGQSGDSLRGGPDRGPGRQNQQP